MTCGDSPVHSRPQYGMNGSRKNPKCLDWDSNRYLRDVWLQRTCDVTDWAAATLKRLQRLVEEFGRVCKQDTAHCAFGRAPGGHSVLDPTLSKRSKIEVHLISVSP